jgi:folate-binding protein YgfZ
MADFGTDYHALRREAGAVWLPRDVVSVRGPEAESYLQGQLSQDIVVIPVGASAWSFLLEPQGKVDALVRVARHEGDCFTLDVDRGWGEVVKARLERFKLRTKVEIEPVDWRCLAIRGPRAPEVAPPGSLDADWPGLPGRDVLGPEPLEPDRVPLCALDAYESVRIEAGVPVMGRELTDRTIPAEAGPALVARAVSFTKGCFTGQELVARVDARGGNVPRHLRGVVVDRNVLPPGGAIVEVDGAEVGALTSVGQSLDRAAPVALAYVKRRVEVPAEATVRWDGGDAGARIEELPLVS